MFTPTHLFHDIPVQILKVNENGSILVQSRNTINDKNMGPEILNPPMTVLGMEWLTPIVSDWNDSPEHWCECGSPVCDL